ncbi:MAG: AraC family transcriptional regulator [Gammaproteobacteria bacterium]|nr:AraC family transcriptional regulator [Gammaproteobacteria bacterium]MBT3869709.1 AraC family transcriptional regulator [Gammaproteobacteria bacterium]MBT4377642.1 AraC family transcriptional regulator [Gammaproteobacteria bacterium]MBT4618380.1 AraC family transcriptional regulator [Gammaproteobacteria bacterium]MBT5197640.1 AraC family transcriptional regulator [Gammaproteobacteria bacterium]
MEAEGIRADISLAGTGIDLSLGRVTYQQRIDQLSNMLDLLGMNGAWLESPRRVSISDYGLLGYAMMSSATLEQAVQIAVKYHKLAGAMFELVFDVDGDEAVLRIDHLLPGGRVGQYTVEELFAGISRLIGLLLGRDHKPSRILLNYEAPDYAEKHLQCFRCPVIFDQPSCQYRFSREELAEPLAEADANTARICEESCRKLLNQMEIEDDIISRICHLLLSTPGEFPKLDAVANKLSLGARTLRRRLNDLGTSYQRILDDVRRELAIEYLRTTNLTVQEIAELLGYSEVTNFRRAFMRWVELSPYQYRKQIGSPA